jgi:hypothetical protein
MQTSKFIHLLCKIQAILFIPMMPFSFCVNILNITTVSTLHFALYCVHFGNYFEKIPDDQMALRDGTIQWGLFSDETLLPATGKGRFYG